MRTLCRTLLLVAMALLPVSMSADPPKSCKPATLYGVSGCELLPDHTCPPGYHKESVGPPNPKMKAPARLMCLPDKPAPKPAPEKAPPQPDSPKS